MELEGAKLRGFVRGSKPRFQTPGPEFRASHWVQQHLYSAPVLRWIGGRCGIPRVTIILLLGNRHPHIRRRQHKLTLGDWISTSNPSYTTRDQITILIFSCALGSPLSLTFSFKGSNFAGQWPPWSRLTCIFRFIDFPKSPMRIEKQETHEKGNASVVQ